MRAHRGKSLIEMSAGVGSGDASHGSAGGAPCSSMPNARVRRTRSEARGLVLGLAALVAACGGGSDPNDADSGSALSATGVCPEPRLNSGVLCEPDPVWARDVRSGACCVYRDLCAAPEAWPVFESPQECESSCRCAMLSTDSASRVERTSLECACQAGQCQESLASLTSKLCSRSPNVLRSTGCGMVRIAGGGGFSSNSWTFEEGSGALIGVSSFSDTTSLPCQTFSWIAGRTLECANEQTCQLCGQSTKPGIPRCQ